MAFGADIARTDTWHRYRKGLCDNCMAGCCRLPVEVRLSDLLSERRSRSVAMTR